MARNVGDPPTERNDGLKRDIVAKLPRNLPSVATATLPAMYEKARLAIEKCVRIDECREWTNKAQALASYARQAKDDRMHKMALRIQDRAWRRAGQLLKQIDPGKGGRPSKTSTGAGTSSRRGAARDAGLSKRQQITASRIAAVPQEDFDEKVESDNPPTATALAEQGARKQPKPPALGDRTEEERKEAAGESIDPEMILVARTDAVALIEIIDYVIDFVIDRANESREEFDALAERVRIALGDQYREPEPHSPDWRQALRQIRAMLDGMGEGTS